MGKCPGFFLGGLYDVGIIIVIESVYDFANKRLVKNECHIKQVFRFFQVQSYLHLYMTHSNDYQ